MGRRLISLMAALAIGTVGALAFAAPGNASTTRCSFPESEVKAVVQDQPATEADLNKKVASFTPELAACLELVFTDKCDGTTVPSATNWATNDNQWTVINLKINGVTKALEGGSSPNTETWAAIGPPANESIQAWLVFDFELEDGTNIHIEKKYGDPWTWEEPKGCVSPSPSASVSPSPSVSVSTSAPASTTSAPPVAGPNDLPVTGASLGLPISLAATLLVGGVVGFYLILAARRRKAEAADQTRVW